MIDTPKANRLHIAIFGRRNAGKSSLINALTGQEAALVSAMAGTTTDPVYKPMELLPIGPVVIIDTAGLDDTGEIGELRIKKTREVMDKTDLALLVFSPNCEDFTFELEYALELKNRNIPTIGVVNKIDEINAELSKYISLFNIPFLGVSARYRTNIGELKEAIHLNAPVDYERSSIVGDLIEPKDIVLLVAPQDIQAPKGRLILPQVQILRDILDYDGLALMVKDSELVDILENLKVKPSLVITDSQVFKKVNDILDPSIPLTSFSILMARYKGDLKTFVAGAKAIDDLKPGDKILIAEACTHHALKGDIGREKLPNWLEEKVGGKLDIDLNAGSDFPENLKEYKMIFQCGSCMLNRKQLLSRLIYGKNQSVPITNYGIAIAHINGILDRVVEIFPELK